MELLRWVTVTCCGLLNCTIFLNTMLSPYVLQHTFFVLIMFEIFTPFYNVCMFHVITVMEKGGEYSLYIAQDQFII